MERRIRIWRALAVLVILSVCLPTTAVGQARIQRMSVSNQLPDGFQMIERPALNNVTINLNPGVGIAGNPTALNAFNNAAARWEALLLEPITLNLDVDMASLPPNVLGSTSSTTFFTGYDNLRNMVAADASAPGDAIPGHALPESDAAVEAPFLNQLPTAAQFVASRPAGVGNLVGMSATRANLLALGVAPGSLTGNDGSITFSTGFSFDFDPSDGIDAGKIDFEGVATHEIGHALGFVSEVDWIDYLMATGGSSDLYPTPLDLFRFDSAPTNFTTDPRNLVPGGSHILWDGRDGTAIGMSTGVYYGDGRQASHWKDNNGLGLMDPTIGYGELGVISANDLRAFDLIGWDVVPEPATLSLLLLGGLALLRRRR